MAFVSNLRASSSSSLSLIPEWASSSIISRGEYDVFLSFSGKDTRENITDHLYTAMKQKGINVFRDEERLKRGKEISQELLSAIEGSQYAVIIISKNYAFSTWCLIELTKIVECSKEKQLKILPLFYHVEPSNVRKQRGSFEKAFANHEGNPEVDKKQRATWRAILKEVGNIAGWHVHDRHEAVVVEEICKTILKGLNINMPNIFSDIVGIEFQVQEMMKHLCTRCEDVRFIGISGMGGVGKTTLARVVYEMFSYKFENSCFIANVSECAKKTGISTLQEQLICGIFKESEIKIWDVYEGMKKIGNRLPYKKVFIVLDNVDKDEQLKALVGSRNWFKEGSRLLITSRDNHLLKRFVDETYEVQPLDECDAWKLFSLKAFKQDYPKENYVELSKDIVDYAGGLPLALEVFGSFLFGRKIEQWKSARDKLKANPNAEILDKLRISFDGLEYLQKELFLDIAFFFNGREYGCQVIDALTSFGYDPIINIEVLKENSLIKISEYGKIWIHDLLVKMCHQIVYCESPNEPSRRSRLYSREDIIHVLKNNTETNAIKGITINISFPEWGQLNLNAFSKMKSLRILEISHDGKDFQPLECHGSISKFTLNNNLQVLRWRGSPYESLLFDSHPHNLIELEISQSYIKLQWDANKHFEKLTCIELHELEYLTEIPNLSIVPNIVELMAIKCPYLSKVHSSVGFLKRLRKLVLQDCKRLKRLPDKIKLPSLIYLNVSNCPKLNYFPNSVSGMEHLEVFNISGTAMRQLPSFIQFSTKLKCLCVGGRSLSPISFELPSSISSLRSLRSLSLRYCNLSDGALPSDFGSLSSLKCLSLVGNKFTGIPSSISFLNLEFLEVIGIRSLQPLIIPPPMHLRYLTTQENLNYPPPILLLSMERGNFTRISDNISDIPIKILFLKDCSGLQTLPKLPFQLKFLLLENCLSLEMLGYDEMDAWISSERLDNGDLSLTGIYFGNGNKPYRILYLSPQSPIWTEDDLKSIFNTISWGPTLESKVPAWFSQRSSSVSGMLQSHLSFNWTIDFAGYALFIVYEVHEDGSSSFGAVSGNNPNFPTFVCRLHWNKCRSRFRLHFRVPEVCRVGLNGAWVFISNGFLVPLLKDLSDPLDSRDAMIDTGVSIETNDKNVELKECGARLVFKHDVDDFSGVLSGISSHGFDETSLEFSVLFSSSLLISGPIKGKRKPSLVELENNQFPSSLNCSECNEYENEGMSSMSEHIKVMFQSSFQFFALFLHKVCCLSHKENTNT